jgi:hypothetical protein
VIQRAFIHLAGPPGFGKTAFVEALLAADDGPTLIARCIWDDSLRCSRESSPRTDTEMQHYRQAGAYAAAVFAVPRHDSDPVEFYETQLMLNYSRAVTLEGGNPAAYADLEVFVGPAPLAGETLYVRRQQDVAASQRARADAWEELLRRPDGHVHVDGGVHGPTGRRLCSQNPRLAEDARSRMLTGIARLCSGPPPGPVECWAVSERFQGIQRAGLVVVNVRNPAERPPAEQLLLDLARLRIDDALFKDILGGHGNRLPITVVVANI